MSGGVLFDYTWPNLQEADGKWHDHELDELYHDLFCGGEFSVRGYGGLAQSLDFWLSDDSGIVDFMAFRPSMGMEFAHTDGNVELGTFYFVEVKSCMADFTSGHGLNFRGDQNWLVCERELAEELREKQLLPHNCTVFVPDKPRKRLISYIKTTPEMARRDHSAAFLLFQMMKRGAHDR